MAVDRDAAFVWVPDRRWTTEPEIIDGKGCRMIQGQPRRACGRPAVATFARRNGWWCYCEEHLYGRKIENGVYIRRLKADVDRRLSGGE